MTTKKQKVTQDTKERVVIDWRMGEMSQRQIAEKYSISAGYVAKLTKGIEQDCEHLLTLGVEYNQGLAKHDKKLVSAIERAVSEKTALLTTLNHYAMENVNQAMQMQIETMRDINQRAEVILKTKESLESRPRQRYRLTMRKTKSRASLI